MSSATQPLPLARRAGSLAAVRSGAYISGAGSDALTAVGFTVHLLEVLRFLVALVAWLPRADVGLALLGTSGSADSGCGSAPMRAAWSPLGVAATKRTSGGRQPCRL